MYLKASTDYRNLVSVTEECLSKLDFEYRRNGTSSLAEFEIVTPAYFRVVIEPNKIPKTRNLLIPSIGSATGSTIEISLGLDPSAEEEVHASEISREFLRSLAESLPIKPWKGLDLRESFREEKRWKEEIR